MVKHICGCLSVNVILKLPCLPQHINIAHCHPRMLFGLLCEEFPHQYFQIPLSEPAGFISYYSGDRFFPDCRSAAAYSSSFSDFKRHPARGGRPEPVCARFADGPVPHW